VVFSSSPNTKSSLENRCLNMVQFWNQRRKTFFIFITDTDADAK
jgi:hypothetical protein